MSIKNTARLRRAKSTRAHIRELGVPRLGHHGLLRRGTGEAIWPDLIDWLSRDF